jgi:hypothetical protein
MKSEQIGELAKALAEWQQQARAAKESGNNPHFRSKFATFDDICKVARTAGAFGISWSQTMEYRRHDDGSLDMCVVTTLMHSSGQWIDSMIPVLALKRDPQAMGSATSYAKRYGLAGILGISTGDDDDGENAMARSAPNEEEKLPWEDKGRPTTGTGSSKGSGRSASKSPPKNSRNSSTPSTESSDPPPPDSANDALVNPEGTPGDISPANVAKIKKLINEKGVDEPRLMQRLRDKYSRPLFRIGHLSNEWAAEVIEGLSKMQDAQPQ